MYHNLYQWFNENGLENHKFYIVQRRIDSYNALYELYSSDDCYRAAVYAVLQENGIHLNVTDAFVDRAGMDTTTSMAAFAYYFAKIDSDNWVSLNKLLEALSKCRVRRSDEYAVVLRGKKEVFTSWNRDAMTLTAVIIELCD